VNALAAVLLRILPGHGGRGAPSPLSPSATCSAAGSTYIQLPLPLLATGAVSTATGRNCHQTAPLIRGG
jgi:hypothetical protein